jgi:mevalonate kinase
LAVAGVRQRREQATAHYDALFDAIAAVTLVAQQALASGDTPLLGALCTQNHSLLQAIGVSTPLLDRLVVAALTAGAYGAKLSGAGVGGVMFAVTDATNSSAVATAIRHAGLPARLRRLLLLISRVIDQLTKTRTQHRTSLKIRWYDVVGICRGKFLQRGIV